MERGQSQRAGKKKEEEKEKGWGGGGGCSDVVLRKYASFNVTLNYVMHKIMEFCVTSSLALDN